MSRIVVQKKERTKGMSRERGGEERGRGWGLSGS